jgi:hypothetical protein
MTRILVAGRFVALVVLLTAISAGGSLAATRLSGGGQGSPNPPGGCMEVDSNMGFRLQTSLDDLSSRPDNPSHFLVSVPFFFGLEDIADASLADPCDVASGAGDGVVDARDLLCSWWTSRNGSMTVSRRDDDAQIWQSLTARRDAGGQVELFGDWTQPLVPREAYVVTVSGGTINQITITGSHDPSAPCRDIALAPGGGPTRLVYNLVYHTMFQHLDEILCGLANVDWVDANGDTLPDDCPAGVFDNASGAPMTLTAIDHRPASPTYGQEVSRRVERDVLNGDLVFSGDNISLIPGEAYLVDFEAPHSGTQACQPHF